MSRKNLAGRAALFALLAVLPLLGAMGGDTAGPTRIPHPEVNFQVRLTDLAGAQVTLTSFALDGQAFVFGQLGAGETAVPFEKIKSLIVLKNAGQLKARLTISDGKILELGLKASLKATGATKYGNYRITMGEVKKIDFLGKVK